MKTPLRLIFLVLTVLFFSCNNTNILRSHLNKAIDYFYVENKNDSVLFYLNTLQTSNIQAITLGEIIKAGALCESGKVDSAYIVINKIKLNPSNEELKCWYNSIKGLIFFRQEKLTESYQCLISTLSYHRIDKRTLALNERIISRILFSMSENEQAIEYLLLSNRHFKEKNLGKSVAVNQKILGRYYIQSKNYSQAINSFKLAENIFLKYNDKDELFYIYINFIDYYIKINSYEKAIYYAQLCETQCKNVKDLQMKSLLYNNLGEIALKLRKYDEAISYYNSTLHLPSNFSYETIRRINANIGLSVVYSQLKDSKKAQFYALEANKLRRSDNEVMTQYTLYKILAESFLTNQSKSLSYSYLDTATLWLDSAYISASQTSKAFYNSKVDLMTQGFKFQQMEQKAERNRTIYLFLILLILTLLLAFVIIYKLQQTKNRTLQTLVNKNLQILDDERKFRLLATKQNIELKKTNRKPSDSEKSELLYNAYVEWLENNRTYCRKDLTLETVAKELNTNREYLSRSINEKGIRFIDLINKYRVQEAIRIISDTQNIKSRYNLTIIASEVGFNSDSVFIDAFKKQTGMTPNQFRENLKFS